MWHICSCVRDTPPPPNSYIIELIRNWWRFAQRIRNCVIWLMTHILSRDSFSVNPFVIVCRDSHSAANYKWDLCKVWHDSQNTVEVCAWLVTWLTEFVTCDMHHRTHSKFRCNLWHDSQKTFYMVTRTTGSYCLSFVCNLWHDSQNSFVICDMAHRFLLFTFSSAIYGTYIMCLCLRALYVQVCKCVHTATHCNMMQHAVTHVACLLSLRTLYVQVCAHIYIYTYVYIYI